MRCCALTIWLALLCWACSEPGAEPAECPCPRGEACDDAGLCVAVDAAMTGARDLGRRRLDAAPDAARPRPDARVVDATPAVDQAIADAERDAAIPDAAPPRDAAVVPDAAPPVEDAAVVPDAASLGAYGARCVRAAQCATGLCAPASPGDATGRCTAACRDADECPGQDVCLPTLEGVRVCAANETGRSCRGAADCLEGYCVAPPGAGLGWVTPQPVCLASCTDDRKCPAGFSCDVFDLGGGRAARLCRPDVEALDLCPGGLRAECPPCVVPGRDPLDTTLCLSLDGPGYCACTCRNAGDCPTGWACSRTLADTGDPTRPGACVPLGGQRCPGQAGGGGLQCLSVDCLTDGSLSYCTAGCFNSFDCPDGYDCEAIGRDQVCVLRP